MLTKRFCAGNRGKEFSFEKKSEKSHSAEKGRYFCKHFFWFSARLEYRYSWFLDLATKIEDFSEELFWLVQVYRKITEGKP